MLFVFLPTFALTLTELRISSNLRNAVSLADGAGAKIVVRWGLFHKQTKQGDEFWVSFISVLLSLSARCQGRCVFLRNWLSVLHQEPIIATAEIRERRPFLFAAQVRERASTAVPVLIHNYDPSRPIFIGQPYCACGQSIKASLKTCVAHKFAPLP